jgi:membrane protein involved in colicin uptake
MASLATVKVYPFTKSQRPPCVIINKRDFIADMAAEKPKYQLYEPSDELLIELYGQGPFEKMKAEAEAEAEAATAAKAKPRKTTAAKAATKAEAKAEEKAE